MIPIPFFSIFNTISFLFTIQKTPTYSRTQNRPVTSHNKTKTQSLLFLILFFCFQRSKFVRLFQLRGVESVEFQQGESKGYQRRRTQRISRELSSRFRDVEVVVWVLGLSLTRFLFVSLG